VRRPLPDWHPGRAPPPRYRPPSDEAGVRGLGAA